MAEPPIDLCSSDEEEGSPPGKRQRLSRKDAERQWIKVAKRQVAPAGLGDNSASAALAPDPPMPSASTDAAGMFYRAFVKLIKSLL